MRSVATVGVLDIGCFSAHLLVIPRGESLLDPVLRHKTRLRLDRALDDTGRINPVGITSIVAAVRDANHLIRQHGSGPVFPLATSSIRDARNATEVVDTVYRETGTLLRFLSGEWEAELSYRAARRWFGTSLGPFALLDIGGGTVELAAGSGDHADFVRSLRLGAREITRTWLDSGTASDRDLAAVRSYVVNRVRDAVHEITPRLPALHTVGNSKVLRQLVKLTRSGSRRSRSEVLYVDELRKWIPRLAEMTPSRRAALPGISRARARQSLAGAVVAEALLTVFGGSVMVCPWSTTHGLLLSLMEQPELSVRGLEQPLIRSGKSAGGFASTESTP